MLMDLKKGLCEFEVLIRVHINDLSQRYYNYNTIQNCINCPYIPHTHTKGDVGRGRTSTSAAWRDAAMLLLFMKVSWASLQQIWMTMFRYTIFTCGQNITSSLICSLYQTDNWTTVSTLHSEYKTKNKLLVGASIVVMSSRVYWW